MPKGCSKCTVRGSGYVKPDVKDTKGTKIDEELQKLLLARAQQDIKYFPSTIATNLK